MATKNVGRSRAVSKKNAIAAPGLVAALAFVSVAQRAKGLTFQTHVRMQRGQLLACDGLVTAGHPIEENLDACPQSAVFAVALSKCVDTLTLTVGDDSKVHVASGKFKAKIPCANQEEMQECRPDPNVHAIGEGFRESLAAAAMLASEGATDLVCGSVLVTANTVIGTNRFTMIEHWHGMRLPDCGMVVPKASCVALGKIVGTLVGFGYNHEAKTCTFWFENGSWLKTQLMENKWPNTTKMLESAHEAWPVPDDLFEGVRSIMAIGDDDIIRFEPSMIRCGGASSEGTYEVETGIDGRALNGKYLIALAKYIETFDYMSDHLKATFRGANCRGLIAAYKA